MMDRRMFLGVVLGVALSGKVVLGQDAPERLSTILDKAIEAAGGAEKLSNLKAQKWKTRVTLHEETGKREMETDYAVQWPDRLRSEVKGGELMVRRGKEAWIRQDGQVYELLTDQLRFLETDMYYNWLRTLVPLRDLAIKLASVPQIDVSDRPAVGMRISPRNHRDFVLLFDRETYLLVKMESSSRALDGEGQLANIETFYSEHIDVAGTKVPTRVRIVRDGELYMEIEVSDIERTESLPDELFAEPEPAPGAPKPKPKAEVEESAPEEPGTETPEDPPAPPKKPKPAPKAKAKPKPKKTTKK